jgi:hypothetical protein
MSSATAKGKSVSVTSWKNQQIIKYMSQRANPYIDIEAAVDREGFDTEEEEEEESDFERELWEGEPLTIRAYIRRH